MTIKHLILLCVITLLIGCQNEYIKDTVPKPKKSTCCDNLTQVNYRQINFDETIDDLELSPENSSYLFKEGKRNFVAFSLPEFTKTYQIKLLTYGAESETENKFGLLVPKIQLYDETFQPTRTISVDKQRHLRPGRVELSFFVNQENNNDRYMLIYPELTEEQTVFQYRYNTAHRLGYGILVNPVPIDHTENLNSYTYSSKGKMRITSVVYKIVRIDDQVSKN